MKSFFTNLGKLLLCGVAVAMIGCTDLQSDMKLMEDNNKQEVADLQSALDALEAKLAQDYALKSELEAVTAAIAAEKAALESAIAAGDDAAIAAAKAELDAAVAAVTTELTDIKARLDAIEAADVTAEIEATLAALDAYVKTMEQEIYARIETVEETLSSLNNLIADEAAARQLADEEIYAKIEVVEETLTALNNIVSDIQAEEYVSAQDLEDAYAAIETTNEALTGALNLLTDLAAKHDQDVEDIYAKIEVVEQFITGLTNRVEDVEDQLAAHLAAFEAYKVTVEEAIAYATESMQEYYTQLLNSVNYQIEELAAQQEEIWAANEALQEYYTQLYNVCVDGDAALKAEMEALISETKEELSAVITNVINLLSDYTGQIEDLANRVQSLVFIPEYSDGKATIEWGLLIDNDAATNFILNSVLTPANIAEFKALVSDYISVIYSEIVGAATDLDQAVNDFLASLIDNAAIEGALAEMFEGIEEIVRYEIAKFYQSIDPTITIPDAPTADDLAAEIMKDITDAINIGSLDVTTIVKTILSEIKAQGVDTVKDLLDELEGISIHDVIAALNSAEFKNLLSEVLSVVKDLEQKVLANSALLKKESVIRYKVQGVNAEALAAAIAADPSVLSYDVETVDVRAAAPALEITNVVAVGDEIHVSVVPQNFNYRFYLTYILEDSFIYGAVESLFEKIDITGLISYSAALVLNDGNNIRSTEYVNFVSDENPEIFTPEVVKNGEVVLAPETITGVKGELETIELCKGMRMAYLSVPNRHILYAEDLEEMGYFGFTETVKVETNNNGVAGPCTFDGLVGTVDDWFDYTFTTVWTVNDIELYTQSQLTWELPESVLVWEGNADANDNTSISLEDEDIAPWFDGLEVGQVLYFEFDVPTSSVACIHLYDSNAPGAVEFIRSEQYYPAGSYYLEVEIDPVLLALLQDSKEIVFAGSGFVMTSLTLNL